MSDLHIDSNHFSEEEVAILIKVLQDQHIDHLHLAGDLSNNLAEVSLPFIQKLTKYFSVSYNLGNHDMLGMSSDEIESYGIQIQKFDSVYLVSLAGWYDYSFVPEKSLLEHLKIKNSFWFDRRLERSDDDFTITQTILKNLEETLANLKGPIIIALHFVPHRNFIYDHPYFQRFNAFLGSQSFHDLFKKYSVTDVVFGHLHHRHKTKMIEGIRYHMRPLGYTREWKMIGQFLASNPQYQNLKNERLHKRYNAIRKLPIFKNYKTEHLAEELKDALTIIDTKQF